LNEQTDLLARVRVASPCRANWDGMEGDARVRFCRECNLNVYNLSEMTGAEAASLVAATEGRLCARFYRRADGTVLTKDCPKGLRAARLRVSRAGVAAFTALLSLFAVAQAKPKPRPQKKSCAAVEEFKIQRTLAGVRSTFAGTVADVNGAAVPGAEVTLTEERTGLKLAAKTSDKGEFVMPQFAGGIYKFEVDAPGFRQLVREHVELGEGETVRVSVTLMPGEMVMGVVVVTETRDIESDNGMTVFRSKAITSLPH
jgi:hypothetical protein